MTVQARETPDPRDMRLLAMAQVLRSQGWGKARIAISRGGTMTVEVEAEGDKVARPAFGSGRQK